MNYSMFIESLEKIKNNSENNEILKNIIDMRNNSFSQCNNIMPTIENDEEDENEVLEIIEVESELDYNHQIEKSDNYDEQMYSVFNENYNNKNNKNKKMKAKKEFMENQYIILKILEKQYKKKSSINLINDTEFLNNIKYINLSNAELPHSYLPNLEAINISNNNITSIKFIENIKNLEYLKMDDNLVDKLKFNKKLNLKHLSCSTNNINNTSDLKYFQNLRFLNMSNNPIKNIKNINSIENLNFLLLNRIQTKNFKNFKKMNNLIYIELQYNNLKSDTIQYIFSNPELCYINLSYNNIQEIPNNTQHMSLIKFVVKDNKINKINLTSWLPLLTILNLKKNMIETIESISACPFLKVINVSSNNINDFESLYNLSLCSDSLLNLNFLQNPIVNKKKINEEDFYKNISLNDKLHILKECNKYFKSVKLKVFQLQSYDDTQAYISLLSLISKSQKVLNKYLDPELILLNYGFYKCIQKTLIFKNNNSICYPDQEVNELKIINDGSLDNMVTVFREISKNIKETISLFQTNDTW
ncbi:hypothetical protein PIROE2DRAFT_5516 [Piromyces sp. E2]|nr:hypothetical protein PIROE2DRAFT_5516 [Piromyces sp. E2]|eukprot:OUM67134.1 hypothetical protein PIROE2DRAFT_5516 [Piromyces sp. E2]